MQSISSTSRRNPARAAVGLATLSLLAPLISSCTVTDVEPNLSPPARAAPPYWTEISPHRVSTRPDHPATNYGFDSIALAPGHRRTLYVGTCYQGLWKSTDAGQSWIKVNTGSGSSMLDSGRL